MDKLRLRAIHPPKITQLSIKARAGTWTQFSWCRLSAVCSKRGKDSRSQVWSWFSPYAYFLLEALEMTDVNYVLPWTQLWDQSILHNRSLPDWFIYFFHMGQELSFPLRWKERDFKTSSINAIMKRGNISEVGGTGRLHTLSAPPQPLLPFFQEHFLQPGPGHCELWEEWYSALVRKGADFPGTLCVPDPFTNW